MRSAQSAVDLVAIVRGIEGAHLVAQLGQTQADSGQRLAHGGGIDRDGLRCLSCLLPGDRSCGGLLSG